MATFEPDKPSALTKYCVGGPGVIPQIILSYRDLCCCTAMLYGEKHFVVQLTEPCILLESKLESLSSFEKHTENFIISS